MRRHATQRPTPSQTLSRQAFAAVVREKLVALGDFGHLDVRHDGLHIVVAQPGPLGDPDGREPVLRLTPLGGLPVHFGLSFATHEGHWQKLPVSGLLDHVLAEAVEMLAPYLAAERLPSDTSGTDN
jgi:hypothetical protein